MKEKKISVKEFKDAEWFKEGLFGDLVEDNGEVYDIAESGIARLRKPVWNAEKCVGCDLCLNNCPQKAITEENKTYSVKDEKCIGCGICAGVCPRNAWEMIKS